MTQYNGQPSTTATRVMTLIVAALLAACCGGGLIAYWSSEPAPRTPRPAPTPAPLASAQATYLAKLAELGIGGSAKARLDDAANTCLDLREAQAGRLDYDSLARRTADRYGAAQRDTGVQIVAIITESGVCQ